MAEIGSVIDHKYRILTQIGKGGMSTVYLAMDTRLNKQWALKELQKKAKDKNNELVIQSAISEAHMIKKLDHSALPRIVDIIDKKDVIYIVMDYIEGQTLQFVIDEQGAQNQEDVIVWAKQLCDALDYLHTRIPPIIYRDMKPSNIMLKPDGNIKVIDFGIAREYKETNLADTVCLGTRGYAAPEQFGGQGQTDARTDIYCLGVTLYHLITGQNPAEPPYEIYPIRYWNPLLSGGLENIILKCTQFNPHDRYQSCAELLYALEHYEEEDDSYKAKMKKKFHIFLTAVIATLVFLAGGIGSMIIQLQLKSADYHENISLALKTNDPFRKREYCIQAISVLPKEKEAYMTLIDIYKDDIAFTVEEATEFKEKVLNYITELQQSDNYTDVCFEIGKLYWYYYEYGNNAENGIPVSRMQSAINWFEDVEEYGQTGSPYYQTAKIYKEIGSFYKEVQTKINEGSNDKGIYKPYFENLQKISQMSKDSKESEIVQLEIYRLLTSSLESYTRQFKNDGVSKKDMLVMLQNTKTKVNNITAHSDKTKQMKSYIESRIDHVRSSIEHAFIQQIEEEL